MNKFFVYFFSIAVLLVLAYGFGDSFNPDFDAPEARGFFVLAWAWTMIQFGAWLWAQHGASLQRWWRAQRQA